MSDINIVAVSGTLTRDPELRHTNSGTAVASLRIAVNRSRKTDDGYTDEVSFFDVTVWSGFGELIARKLRKASRLVVSGRLQHREWQAEDGSKRQAVEIVAQDIQSEDLFKKDGEVAPAQTAMETPAPADDDIPF